MELRSVKNEFKFSSGKKLVCLEERKLRKPEFIREISEFDCLDNGKVFDWHHKHIWKIMFFYFMVLFIVKISTDLMDYCLARCVRNLVLLFFYFSTVEITKDFSDSWCNFQVTYGLWLRLWSWFEIHKTKTKGYKLNWLKKD